MPSLRTCVLCCLLAAGAAAEPVAAPSGGDLREALAGTTRERDELLERVDRLEHQRSLFIVVAGLLTIAVGLLVRAQLVTRRTKRGAAETETDDSDPFPEASADLVTATTVTMRKNATITIRNGATQREEVTGQVQTRRFFSSGDTKRAARRDSTASEPRTEEPAATPPATTAATARVTRTATRQTTQRIPAPSPSPSVDTGEPELKPSTDRVAHTATGDEGANQTDGPRRPVTVRVDHQSDRMEVVEVTVKPGTTGVYRRQAFTVLEVMISVALLATVLSSVIGSVYTLHRSRVLAQEDIESHLLARLFVERIMAESHYNLHSGEVGSLWKASYVDLPGAVPLTAQVLKDKNIVEELPALNDLKVYIEYYPQSALENAIANRQPMVLTNRLGWRDRTMVFRIVIDWTSYEGNPRRHVQLFARSE